MSYTIEDGHGRITEQTVDNGDGTGTRTVYDADGKPVETVEVKDLPIEPPGEKNRRSIEQRLTDDLAAMQAIIDTPNQSLDTAALRKAVKDQARAPRRLTATHSPPTTAPTER